MVVNCCQLTALATGFIQLKQRVVVECAGPVFVFEEIVTPGVCPDSRLSPISWVLGLLDAIDQIAVFGLLFHFSVALRP